MRGGIFVEGMRTSSSREPLQAGEGRACDKTIPWTDHLRLAVRKSTASITRGVGPARQSGPLEFV